MFNYTNGFHVSSKDDKSEVLIRFLQTTPVLNIGEAGRADIVGTTEEVVSSVIMNGALAQDLLDKLSAILNEGKKE